LTYYFPFHLNLKFSRYDIWQLLLLQLSGELPKHLIDKLNIIYITLQHMPTSKSVYFDKYKSITYFMSIAYILPCLFNKSNIRAKE